MLVMLCTLVNMSTFVHNAFTESPFLTIPNVRVLVGSDPRPTVLGDNYQEDGHRFSLMSAFPQAQSVFESLKTSLSQRDWRQLRERLVNLDLDDPPSVCAWLGSAGYVPQAILAEPNAVYFTEDDLGRISTENLGWTPERVTPEVRHWLTKYRDVFAWLIGLDNRQFRDAIKAAREFAVNEFETIKTEIQTISQTGKKPTLKNPTTAFFSETGAQPDLNAQVLGLALRGTAISEALLARFVWDDDGKPTVIASAGSPIEALCMSIHIDRNFSSRGWVQCAQCSKWLDQIRGRDRFCSKECRNYFTTLERRKKINILAEGERTWRTLPTEMKKSRDRWQWIVAWAKRKSKGKCGVARSWAKKELTKMKTRKPAKKRQENSQGGENVTRKTR
jgi:hypothetical protein